MNVVMLIQVILNDLLKCRGCKYALGFDSIKHTIYGSITELAILSNIQNTQHSVNKGVQYSAMKFARVELQGYNE